MTVIAYRSGIMASDSRLTGSNDTFFANCKKIRKIRGWLIGASGAFGPTELFMAKFDPKTIDEKRFVSWGGTGKEDELSALIVSPKGKLYYMELNGAFAELNCEYIAIGSGEMPAIAAMDAGASAIEACRVAIKHEGSCGGRIQTIKLGK